jgi:hypothetical protein
MNKLTEKDRVRLEELKANGDPNARTLKTINELLGE